MAKKKISTLLVALLIMMQWLYAFGLTPQVNAAPISSNIIDSVTMAVYDKSGNVVTEDVYEPGSKVKLDYTWSLPNGHGYKNGDTYTFKLPEQFKLYNDIPVQPLISGDEAVGKFKVIKDTHEVIMTLEMIENLSDVRGTLTFQTAFDMQVINGSTTQIIKIPVKGGEQVFTLHFKPNVDSTIGKSGVAKGYNAKSIDWTVDVNKELAAVQNAVVTDPIPAGLGAPVTVAVYELNVDLHGKVVQGAPVDGSKYTLSTTGNVLKLSFNESPIRTAYRIQYTTPVTDEDQATFVNKATFEGSNKQPVSAEATVKVQHGTALDKKSTHYDSKTQTIDWEIKYNYNEKSIVQANAFLTDLFNDTQELVAGSLHVYPVTIDSNGSEKLGAELPAASYKVTPETATGSSGFKLQFLQDISSAYKIKYQTKAKQRVIDGAKITNKVTSGSGDSGTAERTINQVIITKRVGAVDYQAKTADWSITLNQDSQPMTNVVVKDIFPNKGLRLIPGSLAVTEGNKPMDAADYTVDASVSADQGFTITFNRALYEPVTITYSTEFNMDWLANNATSFPNKATVAWVDSNSKEQTKTVSATFDPRNEVKNNGFKNGVYDASQKQITWTIGVNYNGKTLAGAVVQDTLESGQKLLDNSLAVYNMNIAANGNPSQGTVVDSTYYNYTVGKDNKLTVTFLKPISAPYYIVFKTSLEGKLIDSKVNNTATVFDGTTPVSKNLTASVNIPNGGEYLNKSGTQNGDKINWTVLINRGQSTVTNAKIVDTPSENQLLLPGTFKLFATKVDANGKVSKGAELVKDVDYSLELKTDDNGKQSFELNFLKTLSTAAILEYQSLIVAKDQDKVSNKIEFTGTNEIKVTKDTSTSIVVGVSSGSGTIGGVRGTLTVVKVDASDNKTRLGGATFELYRKSGSDKVLVGTLTTDASGTAVFKKLLAGDYVVKETAAPDGYVLDSKEYPVSINSADGFQLTVANTKSSTPKPPVIKGSLTVKKVDSVQSDLLLGGATFELYEKKGASLTLVSTKTTDANGTVSFDKLPVGDYVVKETAAPTGYVLDSKEHPVSIQNTDNVKLTVTNVKSETPKPPVIEGSLTVKKVDSAQNELLLSGATFELYEKKDASLTLIGTKTTDASGTVVFNKLPAGDYIVKETAAPTGYVLDSKEHPVSIQNADNVKLTITNNKATTPTTPTTPTVQGSLTVKKVDSAQNELLLSGATFELYEKKGESLTLIGTKTTDASGTVVFDKLPAGDYVVKETAAPTGYVLDSKEHPVSIQNADGYTLTVTNAKSSSSSSDSDSSGSGSSGSGSSGSGSSGSSSTPTTTTTTTPNNPASGGVQPDGNKPNGEETIDSNIKVPLGPPTVDQPQNGDKTTPPDQPKTPEKPDGNETIDLVQREVPLGNPPSDKTKKETLPKTGESSPVYIQLAGLALVLFGFMLRRKLMKNT
ncbi:SpaA isopeptide-forming pilin-related protein [Paenibacillus ehimensis]|uniref:SpaA isopeptide-forming pilin-related protein n=1 Tax=Paenibacillus ehimensis TaxID=79264 RepID=UPI003D29AEF5